MSQIIHNIDIPDSGNGDQLRTAFDHQNQMNTELYDSKVDKVLGKDLSSNDYTITDKNKLDGIEEGAEVNVQANWNQNDDTQDDFIIGKPEQLFSSLGYFHHNDLATQTTALTLVANVEKKITNDTLGAQTNLTQAPYGVTNVWNSTTNSFDFSELSIGDTIDLRIDLLLTTLLNNQKYSVFLRVGEGSVAEYDLLIDEGIIKSTSTNNHLVGEVGLSLDYAEHLANPANLYIVSDHAGSVKVNGFYTKILRKGINIVTIGAGIDLQQVTDGIGNNETTNDLIVKYSDGLGYSSKTTVSNNYVLITQVDDVTEETNQMAFEMNGIVKFPTTGGEYKIDMEEAANAVPPATTRKLKAPVLSADAIIATEEWVTANPPSVVVDADDITETATRVFVTPSEKTAITHSNRSILDAITESFTTALKSAYDGAKSNIDALLLTGSRLITSAEITKLSNTSGTNSGDNATNTTSNAYADAKVADSITNGVTTIAPSQNAVFDAFNNLDPLVKRRYFDDLQGFGGGSAVNSIFFGSGTLEFEGNVFVFRNGAGATWARTTAEVGRGGIIRGGTGTATTGLNLIQFRSIWLGTEDFVCQTSVRLQVLSDATNRFNLTLTIGVSNVNSMRINYSDNVNGGKWQCESFSSSVSTLVDSGVSVTANTWYDLKVCRIGMICYYYINNVLVATISTNVPSGVEASIGASLTKTVGTTSRTCDFDYLKFFDL